MMIKSVFRSCSSSPLLIEAKEIPWKITSSIPPSSPITTTTRFSAKAITCSSSANGSHIPKLEPFSRTKLERVLKEPPLIEKCENDLSDYCSTLEGDDSYSCWRAYFELKDLEKEAPKEDVERLILQTAGLKSLIGCLHGISSMQKGKANGFGLAKTLIADKAKERHCPIPDGLPKTLEELAEEESARMPDSPYTRLLRSKGTFPAWYTSAPDHETD
ncbi:hypothetical protein HS088_TW22G00922 [Tripterygium wilfordii]|uniref:CCG-binding protein 1 n=1 Tax=Tripterygium wilfordii TaxID=458696 RepID=A0A7J7BZC8_TRIWF|nr:CCG-binding protein 1-like [Tripterygium wilfordii]KAF5727233.1 hypothetical protein HS088_TW22G00922 [Tripterygium wilfordii]